MLASLLSLKESRFSVCGKEVKMEEGAKIIWVLFGDIGTRTGKPATGYQDRVIRGYRRQEPQLTSKGYTLGFTSNYCTKQAFLSLLGEDATYCMIWHSHGNRRGELTGGLGETISPADVKKVSKNLNFAAIWGCDIQQSANEWKRALNLTKNRYADADKRFASYSGPIYDDDYNVVVPPPIQFIHMENKFYPYYPFPKWIELLP
jgi:hypothetical protein